MNTETEKNEETTKEKQQKEAYSFLAELFCSQCYGGKPDLDFEEFYKAAKKHFELIPKNDILSDKNYESSVSRHNNRIQPNEESL